MISADEKSELLRMVRREIAAQMNIILNGTTVDADTNTESISNMFPGMDTINDRPSVKPFGFHSIPPDGTISVTARVGDHAGSRYVIGHRDANRPTDIVSGETAGYSIGGYQVRIRNGSVQIGKNGVYETAVVGETLATLLGGMLDSIASHTHSVTGVQSGSDTKTTGAPGNASDFSTQKASFVTNGKILSKDGGRF